jgi:hypothetical protein
MAGLARCQCSAQALAGPKTAGCMANCSLAETQEGPPRRIGVLDDKG